jgi:probable phosphoglycerate mutase
MASVTAPVYLVRHGETEWTLSGQHTGRTDIPLTDHGRDQARLVCGRLSARPFAAVFTSPLSRARETAELAGLGDRATVLDDLREWDYGEYEGRRTADIRQDRPGWTLWADGVPGGETAEEVGERADRVIARLREVDGEVAVFGHGHALRALAARWVGLPATSGRLLSLDPATVSVLGYERETPVIVRWNDPGGHVDVRAPQ